jgi:hypothetical protein
MDETPNIRIQIAVEAIFVDRHNQRSNDGDRLIEQSSNSRAELLIAVLI